MTIEEAKKAIAEKIRVTLKEYKISKKEFAVMMGTHPSCITKWLSGKQNFTIKTLFEIEEKLKITLVKITD